MVSATDSWAVGYDRLTSSGTILHYIGRKWTQVTTAIPIIPNDLVSVAMVSAIDGWAGADHGTILHYIGGQWRAVNSPPSPSAV
jgi:hypothetical protein